ncbi:hypothetical protein C8Q78DRAFT_988917 [Trametes maxima]|nr:hypothetical protein C8Q78DRAFT_988917 [Trametes maxima]
MPEGLAPEHAALAGCSTLTVYNALHHVANIDVSKKDGTPKKVLIYGVGGLGHQAVPLAVHYDAEVYACDYKPEARRLAQRWGAVQAFNLSELSEVVRDNTIVFDVAIDFVTNRQSFELCQSAVRRTGEDYDSDPGLIILVGFNADSLMISSAEMIINRAHIKSALYGHKNDVKQALDLLSKKIIQPEVETTSLDQVNQTLDALRASEVKGRKVITFEPPTLDLETEVKPVGERIMEATDTFA